MLTVDDFGQIRRAHRDGMSIWASRKEMGVHGKARWSMSFLVPLTLLQA